MPTFEVDVQGKTYEVDAPDSNTAWAWAYTTHQQQFGAQAPQPQLKEGMGASFGRGMASYAPQLKETLGGLQVLAGKGLESIAPETGRSVIQSGIERVKAAEKEQEGAARPGETSFTEALNKGVGTVLSEWLPYQVGSGAANLMETLVVMGGGALAGSAAAPGLGTAGGALAGVVEKELVKRGVKEAAQRIVKAQGEEAAKKFVEKETLDAAKAVAIKYGSNATLMGQAAGYGFGQTASRAVDAAIERGENPQDIEMGRVLPAGLVSTAAEFLGDKIGFKAFRGLGKEAQQELQDTTRTLLQKALGTVGQVGKGILVTGTKEAPTEVVQSLAERFGAKLSLDDAKAIDEYINAVAASYAMSVVPGGIGGLKTTPKPATERAAERIGKEVSESEAEAEKKQPALQLEYKPEQLIAFPDGSVGRMEDVEKYIASLPEDQRISARARLLGMGERAATPTQEGAPLTADEIYQLDQQMQAGAPRPRAEDVLEEVRGKIQTAPLTTPSDLARIRDEHETSVIESLLQQDKKMQGVADLARANMERMSQLESMQAATQSADQRVREGRLMARVQSLIDQNIPFASTAIADINRKFDLIGEAPLSDEERSRVQNIMSMAQGFTDFVKLPSLPVREQDRFAENQAMEALIKERKPRGQVSPQPVRAEAPAPSPVVGEAPVSGRIEEGRAVRPEVSPEPSIAEDRQRAAVAEPAPVEAGAQQVRQPTERQEAQAFGKQIGAVQPYPGSLRGRVNLPAQKAAKEGDFQGVVAALEKSKNPVVAEIAKRSKDLGTSVVIDDEASERYVEKDRLSRQWSIDGAKMHLDALNKIRKIAPIVDAMPSGSRLGYDIILDKIPAIEQGKESGQISLEHIAKNGHSMFAPLPTGPIKLKTKEDFQSFQKAFEDVTNEFGEDKLKLTSTASSMVQGVAAAYDADSDTIRVPEYYSKREEVLAHEIVHAQVLRSIANPTSEQKPIVARLENLYQYVKDQLKKKQNQNEYYRLPYGVESIQEFVAEGMANPSFQLELNRIEYKNTSAWDAFVQFIADLIGVKKDTAFTELLSIYSGLTPEKPSGEVRPEARVQPEGEGRAAVSDEKAGLKKSLRAEPDQQVADFEQTLRTTLNKFGLKDVGVKLIDGMREAGSYAQQLIQIAADSANPIRTLRHEAIHALRELGFFTEQQWKSLSKMAKDKWIDQYLKQRNIDGKPLKTGEQSRYDAYMREYNGDMEKITEEAVADAFADFDSTKPPSGLMQALLTRLRNLFQSIKSALTKVESPEQIFGKVERGELAAGEAARKGEAKSLRDRATANFLRWFGDSKVVDEKGEPLVVYHGTSAEFNEFKPSQDGVYGPGIYLTKYDGDAATYGGNVMAVYASLQNPYVATPGEARRAKKEGGTKAWSKDIRDKGYDGIILPDFSVVVAFKPTQIKSATGNNGEYSLTDADIRKSLRSEKIEATARKIESKVRPPKERIEAETFSDIKNPGLMAEIQRRFNPKPETIVDRIVSMRENFLERLTQGIMDNYRAMRKYSETGYIMARMSNAIDGAVEGLLFHGQVFNDGGALNIKKDTKGLYEIMKPLGKETDRFLIWMAMSRDSNLPEEKRSFPADVLASRDELIAGTVDGKPRSQVYNEVRAEMNKLNRSVLDVAKQAGLIDQEGYDRFSNDLYYVPLYKQGPEGELVPHNGEKLTDQFFSKELKGNKNLAFADLMQNILTNWSHILSASMKNAAVTQVLSDAGGNAERLGAVEPSLKSGLEYKDGKVFKQTKEGLKDLGPLKAEHTTKQPGTVRVKMDGMDAYYKVSDPLLLESIAGVTYLGPQNMFVDTAKHFKNLLQYGVTLSPGFKVRNVIRDAAQAIGLAPMKMDPVGNVISGMKLYDPNNPYYIGALAGGGMMKFGTALEGKQSENIKRLIKLGVPDETILDTPEKIKNGLKYAFDKYQEWGDKSENANRLALYKQLRDQGKSHLEASFQAKDLMDFSLHGSWPAFRGLTMIIPFLNARTQGLYKLGRDGIVPGARALYSSLTGEPISESDKIKGERFNLVTMYVGLSSAALYLAFKDDEEFKKREQWDRDNFWWIRIPGMETALRIPKPFEMGAFGTLVERTLEQIVDKGAEGKVFSEAMKRMVNDTFAISIVPQMFNPVLDIYANKDSFTGAPIETAGMEKLSKQERVADTTSWIGKGLGGASKMIAAVTTEKAELSPVQVEYLIKGYLGWLGATATMTAHYAAMPFSKGAYPDTKYVDFFSAGFAKELPANQSKFVTSFYENNQAIQQGMADMRHYAALGQMDKVHQIQIEQGDKIKLAKFYDKVADDMAKMRKQISIITNDPNMSGEMKRQGIDRAKQIIAKLAQQAEELRVSMKQ